MLRPSRALLWPQRLFVMTIAVTIALILAGLRVDPATIASPAGGASLLGDVGMQLALAALALGGPWSFRRCGAVIGISAVLGLVFAAAYTGVILLEFDGINTNANILALFVGVAVVAGMAATMRTRRWQQGPLAAIWALLIGTALWSVAVLLINYAAWGSHRQYVFWLNDGAVDEFHRSGSRDFNVFLLQDLQGALFFHPVLGIAVGTIGGLAGGGLTYGGILLKRSFRRRAPTR